jgi:hypothetical protein
MVLISVRGRIEPRTRIKSTKNPNNPIGNRTRDLPVFSSMHQPTPSYFSISEFRVNLGAHILKDLLSKTILLRVVSFRNATLRYIQWRISKTHYLCVRQQCSACVFIMTEARVDSNLTGVRYENGY